MVTVTELNRAPNITVNAIDAASVSADALEATNTINTADISAATDGQALTKGASGTDLTFSSVSGKFATALSNGQALADDGVLYDSVQTAENNATDYLFIGQNTFNENLVIQTPSLSVVGTGRGSLIDAGTTNNPTIEVQSDNVRIRNLAVRNNPNDGNDGISTVSADTTVIDSVSILDADFSGVSGGNNTRINNLKSSIAVSLGSGNILTNSRVESTNNDGIFATTDCIVSNNIIKNAGSTGVKTGGASDNAKITNNIILSPSQNGLGLDGTETIAIGNQIINAGNFGIYGRELNQIISGNVVKSAANDGVRLTGTDQLLHGNRITGSTNSHIDSGSATNPKIRDNLTG